jgi:MOSC domain-containing protein YiiM
MWRETVPAPRARGVVRLICVRKGDGVHECPDHVLLTPESGVVGDRWAAKPGNPDTQVTLMRADVAELVAADHAPLHAAGDNFLVDLDLGPDALPVGTSLRMGGARLAVVSTPHTGCKKFRERFGLDALKWVNEDENRRLRLRGVYCRVLEAGRVAVGDAIDVGAV